MFRWTEKDQSALIESILIGLPLPPIFVYQKDDGKWEVIDGLQRTQTIINFIEGKLTLNNLQILTELNGVNIEEFEKMGLRIKIENFRIRIELVEETDDIFSQYQIFNRLNSNGEKLENQEKRNFLIYKKNPDFYEKLQLFASDDTFKEVVGWNKKNKKNKFEKQENVEILLRYFLGRYIAKENIEEKKFNDLDSLFTKETLNFLSQPTKDIIKEEVDIMTETFRILKNKLSDKTLEKEGKKQGKIANRFTSIVGISFLENLDKYSKKDLIRMIDGYYNDEKFKTLTNSNYSPTKRFYELNKFAKYYFGKSND